MHDSKALSFLGMLEAYYNQRFTKPYDLVDRFIAPSAYMKEVSVAFGVAAERIEVIRNFISEQWLSLPETNAKAFASDYLLYYGRLSPEKGVADIIEALSLQKDNKLRLLIAGTGPAEGELRQKIADSGLGERVELLGFRRGQELLDLIQGAKAVVLPSRWPENMPYTLLESMAMAKIVIAARVGGLSEMIEDMQSSFLFKAGNVSHLAEKIDELMALDIVKFAEMAAKTRQIAEKNGPEKHYDAIIKLYEQVRVN
jgi:glycosyltransferase involved in cell wall biosynthesis